MFCACVMKAFMQGHLPCVPYVANAAAHNWVDKHIASYWPKMTEFARAPIGSGSSPFAYGKYFDELAMQSLKKWAHEFLETELDTFPPYIDPRRVDHFMQKACEYLFTEYDNHSPDIEMTYIKKRAEFGHLKDFATTAECPICLKPAALLTVCKNSHVICSDCFRHPLLHSCPLSREALYGSSF